MLGLRGLIEVEAGDAEAARGLLEQAVQAGVERPAVHLELARLRLLAALENPGSRMGTISGGQLVGVLEPLAAVLLRVFILGETLHANRWEAVVLTVAVVAMTAATIALGRDEGAYEEELEAQVRPV